MAERGTHEALLEQHGLYYDLWLAQSERINKDPEEKDEESLKTE